MKRILCVIMTLLFVSGCALSTIKSPKKGAGAPVQKPVYEEEYTPRSVSPSVTQEKEEAAPVKEKEEVLPLSSSTEEVK